MNRNWLLIAAMIAGVTALTAQSPRQTILVDPRTGIADRSNIIFYGSVSAGLFLGDGSRLSGISAGVPDVATNSSLTVTNGTLAIDYPGLGRWWWKLDAAGGFVHFEHDAGLPGLAEKAALTACTNGQLYAQNSTNAGDLAALVNVGALDERFAPAAATNHIPTRWALFRIPMAEPWWDCHLKGSTNAFHPANLEGGKVFAYSTADPDGSTAWAIIPEGALPWTYGRTEASWMNQSHSMDSARPGLLNRAYGHGFLENAQHWGDHLRQHGITIMVPAAGVIHPTNRIMWCYLRINDTSVETYEAGGYRWTWVEPEWVDYDPRPHLEAGPY